MGKKREKDSFLVFYEWEDNLKNLSDEQMGRLFRAVFAYEKRGEAYSGGDPAIEMAMSFIRYAMDRNLERYKERCETNRENGKKGGRPPKNRSKPRETQQNRTVFSETERNRNEPKKPERERDRERDPDRDRERERDPERDRDTLSCSVCERAEVERFCGELNRAGVPTDDAAKEVLLQLYRKHGFDLLDLAVGEAIARKARSVKYLVGILENWETAGLDTGEKALEYLMKRGGFGNETD